MKCRYCARRLRVIPHSPAEIEPHCHRRGCCWCVECFRGETSVSPARGRSDGPHLLAPDEMHRPALGYRGRHRRRPERVDDLPNADEWAA